MLDVHPRHGGVHTWREFFIHIATISVGLLIAISLEQAVETLHELHQRHQLQHDLLAESQRNRGTLTADLSLESEREWFRSAINAADNAAPAGRITVSLKTSPCIPGTIGANGTSKVIRTGYFAPSDAVWTSARDAGLIARLPVNEARMYARLSHNEVLLAAQRDRVASTCDRIASLELRLAKPLADGTGETWTLTPEQANLLAAAAAEADTAVRGLLFRINWNLRLTEGILRGSTDFDQVMMNDAVAKQ